MCSLYLIFPLESELHRARRVGGRYTDAEALIMRRRSGLAALPLQQQEETAAASASRTHTHTPAAGDQPPAVDKRAVGEMEATSAAAAPQTQKPSTAHHNTTAAPRQ